MPFQYPAVINPGQITNTEVNASAAIALSKLAAGNTIYTDSRYILIAFTIDLTTTGSQAVTGAGFTPTALDLICSLSGGGGAVNSHGRRVGTATGNVSQLGTGTWISDSVLGYLAVDASNYMTLTFTSFDADGFTFSKARTLNPTGTVNCYAFLCR